MATAAQLYFLYFVLIDGFDATPEPIYFRLVSRYATEYAHPRPKLKRGHAVFHVNDMILSLIWTGLP